MAQTHTSWPPVMARAAEIATAGHEQLTVREIFGHLVDEGEVADKGNHLGTFRGYVAQAQRDGRFPGTAPVTREERRRVREANGNGGGQVPFAAPAFAGPGLAVRVRAVAEAKRRNDLIVLASELDALAEAATLWAASVRAEHTALPEDRKNACAF